MCLHLICPYNPILEDANWPKKRSQTIQQTELTWNDWRLLIVPLSSITTITPRPGADGLISGVRAMPPRSSPTPWLSVSSAPNLSFCWRDASAFFSALWRSSSSSSSSCELTSAICRQQANQQHTWDLQKKGEGTHMHQAPFISTHLSMVGHSRELWSARCWHFCTAGHLKALGDSAKTGHMQKKKQQNNLQHATSFQIVWLLAFTTHWDHAMQLSIPHRENYRPASTYGPHPRKNSLKYWCHG